MLCCADFKVDRKDEMPSKICKDCTSEVRRAFSFKQMCLKSDATLRQYIQQRKTLKESQLLDPTATLGHTDHSAQPKRPQTSKWDNNTQNDPEEFGDHFNDIPDYVSDVDTEPDSKNFQFSTKFINIQPPSDLEHRIEDNSLPKWMAKSRYSPVNLETTPDITILHLNKQKNIPTELPNTKPTSKKVSKTNRRFCCDICMQQFTRNRDMVRHQQNKHDADSIFFCDFCQMKFTRKSNIR